MEGVLASRRSRRARRVGALGVAVAAAVFVTAGSASANVGASASVTVPLTATVGQTGASGSLTITNTNTPPNQGESNTVITLQMAPSCGYFSSPDNACSVPDPGVFDVASSATGAAGTACAGTAFSPSAPDASGIVTLTPAAPVVLGPPGGAPGSDRCRVNFTFDVLKQPTIDADAPSPGVQTRFNLRAQIQSSGGSGALAFSSVGITVNPGADADGDGVVDGFDNCQTISANTPSGCPAVSRSLALAYSRASKSFKGRLGASEQSCVGNQDRVTVWKKVRGDDVEIGEDEVNGQGKYVVSKRGRPGKYYSTVAERVVTDVAACGSATAPTLRLR